MFYEEPILLLFLLVFFYLFRIKNLIKNSLERNTSQVFLMILFIFILLRKWNRKYWRGRKKSNILNSQVCMILMDIIFISPYNLMKVLALSQMLRLSQIRDLTVGFKTNLLISISEVLFCFIFSPYL